MTTSKKQSDNNELLNDRIHHGKNIRGFMEMKGWTIDKLAQEIKLSSRTVSNYLATAKLSDDVLNKFAKVLCVDVFYLKVSKEEQLDRFRDINCRDFYNNGGNVTNQNPLESVERILTGNVEEQKKEKAEIKSELKEEIRQLKEENATLRKQLIENEREMTALYRTAYNELKSSK